jgi:hypothetical protein
LYAFHGHTSDVSAASAAWKEEPAMGRFCLTACLGVGGRFKTGQ